MHNIERKLKVIMGLIKAISPGLHNTAHVLKHAVRDAIGIPKHSHHATPRVELPAVVRTTNDLAQPISREAVIKETAAYQAPFLARQALIREERLIALSA